MKCAVCGKEFGAGNTCQHCGTDKVTGLANYSGGYGVPNNSGASVSSKESCQQVDFAQPIIKRIDTIFCYACNEIIPADSRYCPQCNKELYVICPKCGCEYSSQYSICNKCGTNREKYNEEQKQINYGGASVSQPKIVAVDSVICHFCGEAIPASSKFCPYCSQSLWVQCPKCGSTYSSQYPACGECGTNRNEYIKMQQRLAEEEKCKQEEEKKRQQEAQRRLKEEIRRQEEERRRQEEKRLKEELERRKFEEWINSPEVQGEPKEIRLMCPYAIIVDRDFDIEWSVAYNDVECSINVTNGSISHTYTKLPLAGQIAITHFKGIKKDITVTIIARNRIDEFIKQRIVKCV